MEWSERDGRLTLHAREGGFPGMKANLRFRVLVAGANGRLRPVGRTRTYTGRRLDVDCRPLRAGLA